MAATRGKKSKPKFASAAAVARWVAEESALFNDEGSPFHASVAGRAAKLVVVTGENASGKSLFVRVAGSVLRTKDGALPVSVSIRERTGGGSSDMGGIARSMMFGDEQENSTGAVSARVADTAITNNLTRESGSMLILDEPEIGLSDAFARAMGEHLGRQANRLPRGCRGVIIVTHSRSLVTGLVEGFGKTPTHAAVTAEQPATADLQRWLQTSEHRTVEELLALPAVGLDRWRRAGAFLKQR
jgi:hypothetical protein